MVGFIDGVNPSRKDTDFCGAKVLGGDEVLEDLLRSALKPLVVGFDNNWSRVKTALHPNAVCAADVALGDGAVAASPKCAMRNIKAVKS